MSTDWLILAILGGSLGLWRSTRRPGVSRLEHVAAHFGRAVEPGPCQDYFRKRFLRDFLQARPALFLNSSGPASLRYTAPEFAHDRSFPGLAALIRDEYELIDATGGTRLYRRRDPSGR